MNVSRDAVQRQISHGQSIRPCHECQIDGDEGLVRQLILNIEQDRSTSLGNDDAAQIFLVPSCQVVVTPEVRRPRKIRVHSFAKRFHAEVINIGQFPYERLCGFGCQGKDIARDCWRPQAPTLAG